MVMMIGLVTMTALVCVLVDILGRESDAEKRRRKMQSEGSRSPAPSDGHEPTQEAA